jgi:hypothetical protein
MAASSCFIAPLTGDNCVHAVLQLDNLDVGLAAENYKIQIKGVTY